MGMFASERKNPEHRRGGSGQARRLDAPRLRASAETRGFATVVPDELRRDIRREADIFPAMQTVPRRRFLQLAASLAGLLAAPGWAVDPEWKPIFDGKTLAGWKVTDFGGGGEVTVKDGELRLGMGNDLTGVNFTGAMPRMNYELALEAQRVEGSDFFCGLTIPYGETHCTFIIGGWGGGLVGLSSIDGSDASENDTTKFKKFDKGRWYKIRVRVTPAKIEAWIDDEQMLDVETKDKKIEMRLGDIELSKPCGIATFRTQAALRGIRLRPLGEAK